MCLVCMEYLKGKLSDSEFKHNLREYVLEDHDAKALAKAEVTIEQIREALKNAKKKK